MIDFFDNLSTNEWINLFSALGNWLAALGTMAAVFVAIWLAKYPNKIRLRVFAGNRAITGGGQVTHCFVINVTNTGLKTVTVHFVSFCIGRWPKKQSAIIQDSIISRKIKCSENSQITINYEEAPDFKKDLIPELIENRSLKTLCLYVHTSEGYAKKVKPEKSFLDDLKQLQDEWRSQTNSEAKSEI